MSLFKTILAVSGITNTKDGGEDTGILGLLKEKTGKISFKRSAPIMVIVFTTADAGSNGLCWMHVALLIGALLSYSFGKYAEALTDKYSSKELEKYVTKD